MHCDDLDLGAKTAREHPQIGFLMREIDAGEQIRCADRGGERAAAVELRVETRCVARSGPYRTSVRASLAGLAPMADREAGEPARALP